MAAADAPLSPVNLAALAAEPKKEPAGVVPMLAIVLIFSVALFAADNVLLDVARAGWQKIQLLEASFAPTQDAQKMYSSSVAGKIPGYDPRIIDEAVKERQLKAPDNIFKPPVN